MSGAKNEASSETQDVAAGILRAFKAAAAGSEEEARSVGQPDAVRMLDEAFERAEAALGSNVLPFVRRTYRV